MGQSYDTTVALNWKNIYNNIQYYVFLAASLFEGSSLFDSSSLLEGCLSSPASLLLSSTSESSFVLIISPVIGSMVNPSSLPSPSSASWPAFSFFVAAVSSFFGYFLASVFCENDG